MKKITVLLLSLAATLLASSANAALLAAWNFNTLSIGTAGAPGTGSVPPTIAASSGTGSLNLLPYGGNVDDFAGTLVNAVPGDLAEESLSLIAGAAPAFPGNGTSIVYSLSTFGFYDLTLTYASQRTGTGFTSQAWAYSIDGGTTYVPVSTVGSLPAAYAVQTVVFPQPTNNKSSLLLKLTVAGATTAAGNNRFDNVQFNATVIPEPATCALAGFGLLAAACIRIRK